MAKIAQVSSKYIIHATIHIDGVVDRPDVIGAIFGQTEGLLGEDLELRELQKSGRIGRIEVDTETKNGKTTYKGGTLAVIGNLKEMNSDYIRAAIFKGYGVSLMVGIGIPIPIINNEIMKYVAVKDEDIYTEVIDYSFPRLNKPSLGWVNYKQLREGKITIQGKDVSVSPLSSYAKAREIAQKLKEEILRGKFLIQKPIQKFPKENEFKPLLEIR